jgi:hypothetical protein
MPRLDAARLAAWRDLTTRLAQLSRAIDEDLLAEWDIPLGWFDVLAALQRLGGRGRPVAIAAELRLPPSSATATSIRPIIGWSRWSSPGGAATSGAR